MLENIAKELGDQRGEGGAYGSLGIAYRSLGDYRKTIESTSHEKHLKIAKEIGDQREEGRAYGNLAHAYAIGYDEKDLIIAKEFGDEGGEGRAYGNLGTAYQSLGDYRKAI